MYILFTYVTVFNLDHNNYLFVILLYTSSALTTYLQTTTVFLQATAHRADWIFTDSCPLCHARIQSDEGSWSRKFGVWPSWEFFCNQIVVCVRVVSCVLCTHYGLCVHILVYPFFSHVCYCRFTWNVFHVFLSFLFA